MQQNDTYVRGESNGLTVSLIRFSQGLDEQFRARDVPHERCLLHQRFQVAEITFPEGASAPKVHISRRL